MKRILIAILATLLCIPAFTGLLMGLIYWPFWAGWAMAKDMAKDCLREIL